MKVFVTQSLPENGIQILKDHHLDLIIPEKDHYSYEEWMTNCRSADAILNVGPYTYGKDFFDQCPNVKAIALFSVGYDKVDIAEATKRGIPVGNTPGVLSKATSDIAFLLMQMVSRKAGYYLKLVQDGGWGTADASEPLGQELYGKTLGVFGLGRIGMEMAKKCRSAFDMKILYYNRHRNEEAEHLLGAEYVSFEELAEQADVLSVHANFSDEEAGIFNEGIFNRMKPTSIFINTARGGFQNETDLYKALKEGQIWGAGLDVTNPEPMSPDNPLLQLPNVCVLPHIGSATVEARSGMARLAAENIAAFSEGKKMPACVNPEVYKKY